MPFAGDQLQPREVVDLVNEQWPQNRVKATAVILAESQGFVGAYHLNFAPDGATLLSEDCGLMQINVNAKDIPSPREERLFTDAAYNVAEGRQLYDAPMTRDGKPDKRRFQPWVAYTSGWATFPEFWTWHQENGVPVGPWVPTGRYIQKAIAGVANWHQIIAETMTAAEALAFAEVMGGRFGVPVLPVLVTQKTTGFRLVTFTAPRRPAAPPADGVGPRPVPNSGF